MLISQNEVFEILKNAQINITGAFHLGAHECEEMDFYNNIGLTCQDVLWIEAINDKASTVA